MANLGGQLVTVFVGFLVIPFYIKFLGAEGYGLVTFFMSLQAIVVILDFGLSTTANREISRAVAGGLGLPDRRSLLRTLEVFYYGVALVLFLAFAASADFVATRWLKADEIEPSVIRSCVIVAGAAIAVRWPVNLYHAVLQGVEQQVRLNVLCSSLALVKAFGSVAVLAWVSPSVRTLYDFHLGFALVETGIMAWSAWARVGGLFAGPARFQARIVRQTWRFAVGVGWISILAMVIKQMDKIIVSKLVSIEELGYYTTASMAGMAVIRLAQPVQSAVFPRFTRLIEAKDDEGLARVFHRAAQTVSFVATPAACLLIFFGHDLLSLWTQSPAVAEHATAPLRLIALAMLLNLAMGIPFALQLSAGMTWLPLYTNAIGAVLLTPLIWVAVRSYGIVGGGFAWLAFNLVYYTVIPQIVFRHVLPGHRRAWYLRDTLPFMLLGLVCLGGADWWTTGHGSIRIRGSGAIAGAFAYLLAAFSVCSTVRSLAADLPLLGALMRRFKGPRDERPCVTS